MSRKTRKLIWSAPLVAVLAVVGALAIFAAMAPSNAAAQDDTSRYRYGARSVTGTGRGSTEPVFHQAELDGPADRRRSHVLPH